MSKHAFIAIVDLENSTQQIVELDSQPVTVRDALTTDGYTFQWEDHTTCPLVTFTRHSGEWIGLRLHRNRWYRGADDPCQVFFHTSHSREILEDLIAAKIRI